MCCKSLSEPLGLLYHLSSLGLETQPPTGLPLSARVDVHLTGPPEASFLWLLPAENGLQPLELVEVQEATDSTEHDWKQRQRMLYRPAPRPTGFQRQRLHSATSLLLPAGRGSGQ